MIPYFAKRGEGSKLSKNLLRNNDMWTVPYHILCIKQGERIYYVQRTGVLLVYILNISCVLSNTAKIVAFIIASILNVTNNNKIIQFRCR